MQKKTLQVCVSLSTAFLSETQVWLSTENRQILPRLWNEENTDLSVTTNVWPKIQSIRQKTLGRTEIAV